MHSIQLTASTHTRIKMENLRKAIPASHLPFWKAVDPRYAKGIETLLSQRIPLCFSHFPRDQQMAAMEALMIVPGKDLAPQYWDGHVYSSQLSSGQTYGVGDVVRESTSPFCPYLILEALGSSEYKAYRFNDGKIVSVAYIPGEVTDLERS